MLTQQCTESVFDLLGVKWKAENGREALSTKLMTEVFNNDITEMCKKKNGRRLKSKKKGPNNYGMLQTGTLTDMVCCILSSCLFRGPLSVTLAGKDIPPPPATPPTSSTPAEAVSSLICPRSWSISSFCCSMNSSSWVVFYKQMNILMPPFTLDLGFRRQNQL